MTPLGAPWGTEPLLILGLLFMRWIICFDFGSARVACQRGFAFPPIQRSLAQAFRAPFQCFRDVAIPKSSPPGTTISIRMSPASAEACPWA